MVHAMAVTWDSPVDRQTDRQTDTTENMTFTLDDSDLQAHARLAQLVKH